MTKTVFKIIYIIVSIILFALLLFIIIMFRIKVKDCIINDYIEHFKNIGLVNKQNKAPVYRNMKYDPNNANYEIYYFDDVDVDFRQI